MSTTISHHAAFFCLHKIADFIFVPMSAIAEGGYGLILIKLLILTPWKSRHRLILF